MLMISKIQIGGNDFHPHGRAQSIEIGLMRSGIDTGILIVTEHTTQGLRQWLPKPGEVVRIEFAAQDDGR